MEIHVNQIRDDEGLDVSYVYAEGEPELRGKEARLVGQTAVNLRATREGDNVELSGGLEASVQLECDRCLAHFPVSVKQSFNLLYVPAPSAGRPQEERELGEDDLSVSVYEGEVIDLDDLVREQVELSLPMFRLCSEDCAGLCSHCGANLNEGRCSCKAEQTDSRWDALKSLKSEN